MEEVDVMNKPALRAVRVFSLAAYDFKGAYAGSLLGSLWAIAEPLVTVLVYWFVYAVAFGGDNINGIPYYLWLSAGIVPWFFISNGVRAVAASYRDYSYLIKKVNVDNSILPKVRTLSAFFSHLIFFVLVIIFCIFAGAKCNLLYVLLPMVLSVALVFGVGRILALLCGIYKDVLSLTGVILNIGFWITPIFWSADAVSGSLRGIVYLNPATILVNGYRNALLFGKMMDIREFCGVALLCMVLIILGRVAEKKILPDITDRL